MPRPKPSGHLPRRPTEAACRACPGTRTRGLRRAHSEASTAPIVVAPGSRLGHRPYRTPCRSAPPPQSWPRPDPAKPPTPRAGHALAARHRLTELLAAGAARWCARPCTPACTQARTPTRTAVGRPPSSSGLTPNTTPPQPHGTHWPTILPGRSESFIPTSPVALPRPQRPPLASAVWTRTARRSSNPPRPKYRPARNTWNEKGTPRRGEIKGDKDRRAGRSGSAPVQIRGARSRGDTPSRRAGAQSKETRGARLDQPRKGPMLDRPNEQ